MKDLALQENLTMAIPILGGHRGVSHWNLRWPGAGAAAFIAVVTTGRRAANMSSRHQCHGSHDLWCRAGAATVARGASVSAHSGAAQELV